TPEAQKFLGLIPADIGRPLININPTVDIPDFQALVLQVIANFRPVEKEFWDPKRGRLLLKILPYRTVENKIDGAVITIVGTASVTAEIAAN
ncbi:MAG TPA: PAS domain-containing protein, partial [Candidatus Acidoferrum sp.]|nr:PAS domain-containing protein [Candidatus Acidoferrum sp.]